jgi:ethanolamine permease
MGSYLALRWRFPQLHRPYRSPLGIAGAVVSMAISLVVLAKLVQNGVLGPIIWMGLGIAYFAFYARKRLILAPEEEFAQHANTQNTTGSR